MDEGEFRRMLERFPVVRKKTYARVEWNSMYDKDESKSAITSLHEDTQVSTIRETDSLRDAMGKFLDAYFSAQEIMKIQREFEKVVTVYLLLICVLYMREDFLSGVCLEDVNDLCAQFVATKE
ncbi:hypothetical protein FI667_g492, partial [Globisporangium splendens]